MRRRWLLLALAFFAHAGVGAAAAGEPTSCAIRLATAPPARAGKSAALPALLADLPVPPLAARPLLAAPAPASGGGSAASTAVVAAATGPARHPFAAWQVLHFETAAALAAALPVLRRRADVLEVEPQRCKSQCASAAATHAPADTAGTLALAEIPWNVERVGAPAALAAVVPDSSLVVAVIDTGADLTHPDLAQRLWRNDDPPGDARREDNAHDQNGDGLVEEWEQQDDDDNGYVDDVHGFDFTDAPGQGGSGDALQRDNDPDDDNGHGTHVAGIIAADGRLRGVAPFVRLMPVRAAFNRFLGGALETDDAAAAIVYAVDNGARVLNLSWGDREESILVRAAIDYAVAHDVVVVAAAGNGGSDAPHYPSGDARVVGVAASNRNGERSAFSNFGAAAGVALAAPGEEGAFPAAGIRSLLPLRFDDDGTRDGLGERRGTSMAAPHVAGLAAIVLCRADRPDAVRVRAFLVAAARRPPGSDWSAALGHGEVDGVGAVHTDDDLTVAVLGPAHPYRADRFTLVGTVLSGDLPRRSLLLTHAATGTAQTVVAAVAGQVVADTLATADLSTLPQGDWEYTLRVHTASGRSRERHGAFRLDRTPPAVEMLRAQCGWRSGEPRWLVSVRSDDAVRVHVSARTDTATLLADAGYAAHVQLEAPATAADSAWLVTLENEAGGALTLPLARPPQPPPWPAAETLEFLHAVPGFVPTGVWGESPLGPVVWGRAPALSGMSIQAFAVLAERLVPVYDVGRDGYPWGYADVNGDGASDLLFQAFAADGLGTTWLVTRGPGLFPDSIAASQRDLQALGLHQLDPDAQFEAILSRDDRLLLFDDAAGRAPALVQSLENPLRHVFNPWGTDAVCADLDDDGRIELAIGDAEGFVCVYERGADGAFALHTRIDTGGTYAYDLTALPEGGILVGAQRTDLPTGDGFPTALYEFVAYGSGEWRYPFLTRANSLDAGSTVARSPGTGATWLALVQGSDLYLARGDAEPREQRTHAGIASGDPPVLGDLDDDGELELVLRTRRGAALYRLRETVARPHGLHAESLGADRLRLTWVAAASGISRVERREAGTTWLPLGTTTASTWIDSLLVPFVPHRYRIADIAGDSTVVTSNEVVAQAQPLPRLLSVQALGDAALRLRVSNALHPATLVASRFHVRVANAEPRVQQLSLAEDGRVVDLLLATPLGCDSVVVCADGLRDLQWGLLNGPCIGSRWDCPAAAFFVVAATAHDGGVDIEWSRAPDARALDIASYELTWSGSRVVITGVERPAPARTLLSLAPESPLVGRGIPYHLRIVGPVRGESDGAALAAAGTVHHVYVEGAGAAQVFPVPNPVRGTEVVFVEAAADTRVVIFNLEGVRVRELHDPLGGGLRWDLRAADGAPVASGVYLYVARDGRGTSRGRLAVLR